MERRTKLERANIRYYEKEGLITPQRHDNGYRDYSEEDVNTLLKVKLLRRLKLSIEEIRSLQRADEELGAVLERKIQELERKRQEIEAAQRVCERMREDQVRYSELNAAWYLRMLEEEEKKPRVSSTNNGMHPESYVITRDVIREQPHPVKRLLARETDFVLVGLLLDIILYGIFRMHPPMNDMIQNIVNIIVVVLSLAIVYLTEPLMLHKWGCTPGKWLMGIRIHNADGCNLTVVEGRERTREMLWKGLGFQIPIYSWIRLWKTYKQYGVNNEPLDWDFGLEYEFVDQKDYRPWVSLAVWGAAFVITSALALNAQLPHHRGDLTVLEFAENFNDYRSYLYGDYSIQMNADGQLIQSDHTIVYWGDNPVEAKWQYEVEDGVLTGIVLTYEGDHMLFSSDANMMAAASAFVGAQPGVFWKGGLVGILAQIENRAVEDYTAEFAGVIIECDYEYTGYMDNMSSSMLIPQGDGVDSHYTVTFSMRKE
jgi:DNA-binding transcriptional MerR regulator